MMRTALALLAPVLLAGYLQAAAAERLAFNRDVRPILAEHCFSCHGPDAEAREAGLRLDVPPAAASATGSDHPTIVPGRPEASELVGRIHAVDPDVVMPPAKSGKILSAVQRQTLTRWVAEGALYEPHWAYVPPVRPAVPKVRTAEWARNAIDRFILARLEQEGLGPAAEADRSTLIRRLTLDLTGLPPTRDETAAFLADAAADAYERVVDRLLASPHYGERMAVDWLDAARYADTNGYQVDRDRELWAWRDWVIRAFNAGMPFDQFTIEQIAGDLLPDATRYQRIATGFHRNHMLNEESGALPEEFLAESAADRVETTATVWLGQTFGCARCHDHKSDPWTQKDFYALKAFFHNVNETGMGDYNAPFRFSAPPYISLTIAAERQARSDLETRLAAATQRVRELEETKAAEQEIKPAREAVAALHKAIAGHDRSIPTTLVMEELPIPRKTFILVRGNYATPGAEVEAATPAILPPLAADQPANRLGLARWLVAGDNPLTARVAVNRLWQTFFGAGIVVTAEDFGSQGDPPSHPELLDWLAVEFRESGWDVKRLVRLLVTSATYRQRSAIPSDLAEHDPRNRLLARGPRFRLPAEFIRDQALAASGLLVPTVGGPSVKPYHPPGLYEQVVNQRENPKATYEQGKGADLHRRSLYTYWKRSVPHPAMLAFDAPFRETCTVRRSRTNTPLQALTLMNDPTYVEAAKFLAARMIRAGHAATDRIEHGFWLVLARPPRPREVEILSRSLDRFRAAYEAAPAAAIALLEVGDAEDDAAGMENETASERAAYTLLAGILLGSDEAITRN